MIGLSPKKDSVSPLESGMQKEEKTTRRFPLNRGIIIPLITAGVTIVIFCVRRGWQRPFFALTDALFIGGLTCLIITLTPRVTCLEGFDGFVYTLRQACAGIFPKTLKSYSTFKKERSTHRNSGGRADRLWITPLVFFLLGVIFSLFFL